MGILLCIILLMHSKGGEKMTEKIKVFNLVLKVYVLEDIKYDESLQKIASLIDSSLCHDADMSKFHSENKWKLYSFNSFYPLEKSKIYQAGKVYSVVIRTIDENLVKYFEKHLVNEYTKELKALTIQTQIIPKKHIDTIYTLTPAIIKTENGYWRERESIDFFEERLTTNLVKKYNSFFGTKLDEDFELFTYIRFDNRTPIATKYKNCILLGDKITLKIADNDMAQEIIYLSLATGLLEMNSRGYGFVNKKWL